jgi:transcription elongation factor Elf1
MCLYLYVYGLALPTSPFDMRQSVLSHLPKPTVGGINAQTFPGRTLSSNLKTGMIWTCDFTYTWPENRIDQAGHTDVTLQSMSGSSYTVLVQSYFSDGKTGSKTVTGNVQEAAAVIPEIIATNLNVGDIVGQMEGELPVTIRITSQTQKTVAGKTRMINIATASLDYPGVQTGSVRVEWDRITGIITEAEEVANSASSGGWHVKYTSKLTSTTAFEETTPQEYTCPTCGEKFSSQAALDEHVRTVHNTQQYTCPSCGETFTSQAALDEHMRTVHGSQSIDVIEQIRQWLAMEQNKQMMLYAGGGLCVVGLVVTVAPKGRRIESTVAQ